MLLPLARRGAYASIVYEIARTLIERILSWPVAVFLLCLLFRKPIARFLERVVVFKAPGVELSAPASAEQQTLSAAKDDVLDQLGPPIPVEPKPLLPEALRTRREIVKTYGGNSPILTEQMELIKGELNVLQMPLNSEETAETLIRQLAVTQLQRRAEITYRLIFGSQILALRSLDTRGPQTEEMMRAMFEVARSTYPTFMRVSRLKIG